MRRRTPPLLRAFVRNKGATAGAVVVAAWIVVALCAPWVAPYDPLEPVGLSRQRPSSAHLLGTDLLGRDVLSRILYGSRISLTIGLISVGIGLTVGIVMGLPSGYYGGRVDAVVMRLIDAMLAFPGLLLALVVIAALGPGLTNVMIAVGVSSVPLYARLVRGSCLSVREMEYVQAARAVGSTDDRIMARHILPNLGGPIIVLSTLQVGSAILVGSALSFLGMGAQPPTPEWGLMAAEGRSYLATAWWISSFAGCAIFTAVLGMNLTGDGLRAALDPRARGR
ncbi:MAG: ABC transporter permease [Armatimonadota bacterium]|nr:ABC transporter permease [Armatimonadota bacterium]